jgi:hypothetical protein
MQVVIHTVDVNGDPVANTKVTLELPTGSVDLPVGSEGGASVSIAGNVQAFSIRIHHPNFEDDDVSIDLRQANWTNPVVHVGISGATVDVRFPLSRIRYLPGQLVEESRLTPEKLDEKTNPTQQQRNEVDKRNKEALRRLNQEVRGVLMERDGERLRPRHAVDYDVSDFRRLDPSPPGTSTLGSATAATWDRFKTASVATSPAKEGAFFLVEYGERDSFTATKPRKTFLVSFYVPFSVGGSGIRRRDVIVFLPPHTARPEYAVNFPYGLNLSGNRDRFEQPFFSRLAVAYMFGRHWLVHQVLAAKRNPVLVMPIWPSTTTDPLLSQVGLMRLLREVLHFAHRQGVTTPLKSMYSYAPPLVGSERIPTIRRELFARFEPTPSVGQVAVAGYSVSGSYLRSLFTAVKLPPKDKDYGPEFGVPPRDETTFANQWIESWDLDGSFGDVGKDPNDPRNYREEFFTSLIAWYRSRQDRGFRIARSSYTGGTQEDLTKTPLSGVRESGASIMPATDASPGVWAYDYYAARSRWSALVTSGTYLKPPTGGTTPPFGQDDEHQFLPNIGLAWALMLSPIGR